MSLGEAITNVIAIPFNLMTQLFAPPGAVCFLVKRAPNSAKWLIVKTLTEKYSVFFGRRRSEIVLMIAESAPGAVDVFAPATHLAYGAPRAGQIDIYQIDIFQRDETQTDGRAPVWRFSAFRMYDERFTLPVISGGLYCNGDPLAFNGDPLIFTY